MFIVNELLCLRQLRSLRHSRSVYEAAAPPLWLQRSPRSKPSFWVLQFRTWCLHKAGNFCENYIMNKESQNKVSWFYLFLIAWETTFPFKSACQIFFRMGQDITPNHKRYTHTHRQTDIHTDAARAGHVLGHVCPSQCTPQSIDWTAYKKQISDGIMESDTPSI